jgi:putative flavoprotein involved in K+ transport
MLGATLPATQPSAWAITEGKEPAAAGGVTEAWIEFETALLTTLYELKGHEEPAKGSRREARA